MRALAISVIAILSADAETTDIVKAIEAVLTTDTIPGTEHIALSGPCYIDHEGDQ